MESDGVGVDVITFREVTAFKVIRVLCPLGHTLPEARVRLGESAILKCFCGAEVESGPFLRDGEIRVSWAMVKAPRSHR